MLIVVIKNVNISTAFIKSFILFNHDQVFLRLFIAEILTSYFMPS